MNNMHNKSKAHNWRNTSNQSVKKIPSDIVIDYKNIQSLQNFTSDVGRILNARYTGASRKQQRAISNAIKRARFMALMPYLEVGECTWK